MTETLQKDPHSEKHGVWGRFESRGPTGSNRHNHRHCSSNPPDCTHKHSLIIPAVLWLLRTWGDFPDSDNISNWASKSHFTNHPAGQRRAAGLHSLSHSSCVHVLLHAILFVHLYHAADSLWLRITERLGRTKYWEHLFTYFVHLIYVNYKGGYVDQEEKMG